MRIWPIFLLIIMCKQLFPAEITIIEKLPAETMVVICTSQFYADWKQVGREVTDKKGLVSFIPKNQSPENWIDIIEIQFDEQSIKLSEIESLYDEYCKIIREVTLQNNLYGKNKWQVVEKDKNYVIYESASEFPTKGLSPEHFICKVELTERGYYRVGYTHRGKELNDVEKNKWVTFLKESAKVFPIEEATKIPNSFSMADKLKDSLELASFRDWQQVFTSTTSCGWTLICRVPAWQSQCFFTECLEVTTRPYYHIVQSETLFNEKKKSIQNQGITNVKILKQNENETIYYYSYMQEKMNFNVVERLFVSDVCDYCITYRQMLPGKMAEEDILKVKKQFEEIKCI